MPLTITIPVSQADAHRLEPSIAAMEFLGGLQKHTVLFCAAPSVQQPVAEIAGRIRAICPNTFIEILPREPEPRRRFGAFNMIFRDSVEILWKRGNKNPWFWWELDMTPILAGWADRLELEYHQKGQPFMGVRRAAKDVACDMQGKRLPDDHPDAQGHYMVATGIYPWNFKDGFSTLYRYPDPTGNKPADVNIRFEVNPHLHHTELIAHHYKTGNYRRENGRIVCDDFESVPGADSYAGVVSQMAYVVHGCKDGTLSALVLSEAPSNVTASGIEPAQPSNNAELIALRSENDQMRHDIAKMQEDWSRKENSYAEEIEQLKEQILKGPTVTGSGDGGITTVTTAPQAESEITEKPLPTLDAVKAALKEAKKSVQLANLAADFGCNKKALRSLLETDKGIKIAPGGLAWVSLAA